jgi:hypothetical protein
MSGRGIISEQHDEVCEMCGSVDECRPYGPNNENICFDCGMKDEETTKKKMATYIFGEAE